MIGWKGNWIKFSRDESPGPDTGAPNSMSGFEKLFLSTPASAWNTLWTSLPPPNWSLPRLPFPLHPSPDQILILPWAKYYGVELEGSFPISAGLIPTETINQSPHSCETFLLFEAHDWGLTSPCPHNPVPAPWLFPLIHQNPWHLAHVFTIPLKPLPGCCQHPNEWYIQHSRLIIPLHLQFNCLLLSIHLIQP